MRSLHSSFVLLTILFLSCVNEPGPEPIAPAGPGNKIIADGTPPGSFSDTLIIGMPAAVFFKSDSLQLARIEEITPEDEFKTMRHNCIFLEKNARSVLKSYWPSIRQVESAQARYLLFIKENEERVLLDLQKQGDICGVFLFDGRKDPELADMMNINTSLGFYFDH